MAIAWPAPVELQLFSPGGAWALQFTSPYCIALAYFTHWELHLPVFGPCGHWGLPSFLSLKHLKLKAFKLCLVSLFSLLPPSSVSDVHYWHYDTSVDPTILKLCQLGKAKLAPMWPECSFYFDIGASIFSCSS